MSHDLPRREFILKGAALSAAATVMQARFARAFPSRPDEIVVPWLDQPDPNPDPFGVQTLLVWEDLDSWLTPNEEFFSISHFDRPVIDAAGWTLEVDGLVANPSA